ncbi:uncharacterized protein LOC119166668 isoform X2 [Rhipicephalus microplus]|uniref:uncharacterized protein LOC119166668 isoform X2 n=1 Tax=Rhipicephalus microplus TaxID=6941 RepID=UPI003F6D0C02
MAYELRFHVIQVVLVWLPLVVHSIRPVDTPAKQLQFPEDCGFSTDPSACADTPDLSRPFGTSSSSETSFLSSNKSGNSERQWFSGRGGSTTVAMAYELRFHVIQCSAFKCSWSVTGPRPCLDKLTISSRRLQGHANTIRAPVRLQAGPPGPFKSTKQRGAVLTLTCRAWASKMQRPARHSTPTTTDAQSITVAKLTQTWTTHSRSGSWKLP